MEIRSQLEVRGLFLKFLSQISARNKFALIKFLENIVNEHRNSKTKQNCTYIHKYTLNFEIL